MSAASGQPRATILVVEDNKDLAYGLRNNLEIEGYRVEIAGDGPAGIEQARALRPDLIILDLMLPELDGFRVLRAARQEGFAMPILVLTARGDRQGAGVPTRRRSVRHQAVRFARATGARPAPAAALQRE